MTRVRILYADTDMAGVVYHANYLRFFEAARTDILYGHGIDVAALQAEHNLVFTISEVSLKFHDSAVYGDELKVAVTVSHVGPARFVLHYEVRREADSALITTGSTTLACIDWATKKIVRLPAPVRAKLTDLLEETSP